MESDNGDITLEFNHQVPFDKFFTLLKEIGKLLPVPLEQRVDIGEYAKKIYDFAEIIFAKNEAGELVGLVAIYMNDHENCKAYLTILGVRENFQSCGAGSLMVRHGIERAKQKGMKSLSLTVHKQNLRAIRFYEKLGLRITETKDSPSYVMEVVF